MVESRKKILYVITKSNFGGAQRYVYELATNLPSDQYEVVVAFGGAGILKDKLEAAGIRTITIDSFQRDISLGKELRSLSELWKLYKTEKPDVVHLNSSKAVAMGALVGRLVRIPKIISTVHGWPFLEPRHKVWKLLAWLGSWLSVLLSHRVIVVSDYDLKQKMPLQSRKLIMIHTALPPINFKSLENARTELLSDDVRISHINDLWLATNAELNHNKNLFAAVDAVVAYNQTAQRKIFYCIISDGELKKELADYIKELETEKQIMLLGYVDDARSYLKAFDIFLLPSKKEGMPYAVLEAGAAGLPTIASKVGGIPEVITDHETGLLIDPKDTTTITESLKLLSTDKDMRHKLGKTLQEKIHRKFNLSQMIEKTIELY